MKRPADPDVLWLYDFKRRATAEALAGLVEQAAAITRRASAQGRRFHQLGRGERDQLKGYLDAAYRLAVKLRGE